MTSRVAHRAQREALRAAAGRAPTVQLTEPDLHVEHFLHIEHRLAERHSDGSRHHEHVTVNGRGVEVTEDNLGIVELHLS